MPSAVLKEIWTVRLFPRLAPFVGIVLWLESGPWTVQGMNSKMQSLIHPSVRDLDLANGQSKSMLVENNLVAKGQLY